MQNNNIFDRANNFIRNTESSLVNLLSAIAPWGAPLAPATMAYNNMVNKLDFDQTTAGIIAGVIEVLGLAAVHTALTFWQHNRRYNGDKEKKQPVWLVIGMFALYLTIILVVNVAMEVGQIPGVAVFARALLSLLSVPAAVIMAIRAQHTALLAKIENEEARAQATQDANKQTNHEEQRERVQMEMEERLRLAEIQAQERVRLAEIEARERQEAQVKANELAVKERIEKRAAKLKVREIALKEREIAVAEQTAAEAAAAIAENETATAETRLQIHKGTYEDFMQVMKANGKHEVSAEEIAERFSVSVRTGFTWMKRFKEETQAALASELAAN